MSIQRILIEDKDGDIFRICKIGLLKDTKNEDYIKISFPDLIGNMSFAREDKKIKIDKGENIVEFSSHFWAGVSHFKTTSQERLRSNQSEGNFTNSECIHLFSYTLYDLNHFKKFTKKTTNLDYKISKRFNPAKGKILKFYISPISDEVYLPAKNYTDLSLIKFHPFESKKYRMLMIEYEFKNIDKSITGVSFFCKYNQKEDFVKVELPK